MKRAHMLKDLACVLQVTTGLPFGTLNSLKNITWSATFLCVVQLHIYHFIHRDDVRTYLQLIRDAAAFKYFLYRPIITRCVWHPFNLQATVGHGHSMNCGHYTDPINCYGKYLIATIFESLNALSMLNITHLLHIYHCTN